MVSVPIPTTTKDTIMGLTFYYITEHAIYDLVKVDGTITKKTTLRSVRDGFSDAHKQDPNMINFYFYNDKTFEWLELADLDESVGDMKFPDNTFLFLIQHKSKLLYKEPSIQLLFKIEGIQTNQVNNIRKVTRTNKEVKARDVYQFFYN
jgi:hypothetical protein